jgi:hypothetical protein
VSRVDETVEEADGDGFNVFGLKAPGSGTHLSFVGRALNRAIEQDPLVNFKPAISWDQCRRFVSLEVIKMRPALSGQVEQIAKTTGGQEPGPGTATLNERVRGNRRSMPKK